jgi:hypothetical protein
VGGISLIELNMLEKEFLNIIDWKLSCSGHLLQYYYTSLVSANPNPKYSQELEASSSDSAKPAPPEPSSPSSSSVKVSQHHTSRGDDNGDVNMESNT